jgi:transcriptional regulator with XRE-family HTH domain
MINNIKEKRIALGLSQVKLGILCLVSNSAIGDFERGDRKPWPRVRQALAKALNTTEAELFPGDVK